jgi:nuclear transport factor 2 (NTF2) superfamily protein
MDQRPPLPPFTLETAVEKAVRYWHRADQFAARYRR